MDRNARAFTLVEMLLVVAIIVILISLLQTSLVRAKDEARRVTCLTQMHAVTVGWRDYATDHVNRVVNPYQGADGWIGSGNSLAANRVGLLPPYFGMADILQCPMDTSGHYRTYSMNDHLGGRWGTSKPRKFLPQRPAQTFVLLEENDPRGWNMGSWVTYLWDGGWVDYVSGFHNSQMNISFADAHVETWRWEDDRTMQITWFYAVTPGNPDLERLQAAFVTNY